MATHTPSHQWIGREMQLAQAQIDVSDQCAAFLSALRHKVTLTPRTYDYDGGDVASAVNMETGEQTVCDFDDFREMRDYAILQWRVLSEVIDIVKNQGQITDPMGRISDLINDAQNYTKGFHVMTMNMPDVVANNA